jgi:hypothetical protein
VSECANPGHAVGKVDPRTIPEYAYDDSWCHECQEILKKVHMIQKHIQKERDASPDGMTSWDRVEKYRSEHGGKLPTQGGAE